MSKQSSDSVLASFSINRHIVDQLVRDMGLILSKAPTIPVYGYVRVSTEGASIACMVNDGEVGCENSYPATVQRPGTLLLPPKALEILASLKSEARVELVQDSKGALHICIQSGRSNSKLPTIGHESFPAAYKPSEPELIRVGSQSILGVMSQVSHCAPKSAVENYAYIGLETINTTDACTLRAVATDGKRISFADIKVNGRVQIPDGGMLVPVGLHKLWQKMFDGNDREMKVYVSQSVLCACDESKKVWGRGIEDSLIDYRQVLPPRKSALFNAVVDRETLLGTMRRATIARPSVIDNTHVPTAAIYTPKFDGNGGATMTMVILSRHSDTEFEERIECKLQSAEDRYRIGINSTFMISALEQMEEETFTIECYGELRPVLLTADGSVMHYIMPLRLDSYPAKESIQ